MRPNYPNQFAAWSAIEQRNGFTIMQGHNRFSLFIGEERVSRLHISLDDARRDANSRGITER